MIELSKGGAYLLNGTEIIEDGSNAAAELSAKLGNAAPSKEEAAKNTIAYGILNAHNTSGSMDKLKIKFDKMTMILHLSVLYRQQEHQDWKSSRFLMF